MRSSPVLGATLVAVSLGSASSAEVPRKSKPNPYLDVPLMFSGHEVTATGIGSGMRIDCALIPGTGPRRAECTLSQVFVMSPDRSAVEERKKIIAGLSPKLIADVCKDHSQSTRLRDAQGESEFAEAVAACKTHDTARLKKALIAAAEREGTACRVQISSPTVRLFEQVDANSWVSTNDGICAVGTQLLWRKPGDGLTWWNLKQTTTKKPNADPDSCSIIKDQTAEWRSDYDALPRLDCERITF
jgi:hypothetical protein